MRSRSPFALSLLTAFGVLALVVTATGAGLYQLTDAELSGPEQPIDFSHALHASALSIECLYCHSGADKSQHAGIPAVSVCLGCHQWIKTGPSEGSAEEIAKIAAFAERGESIPWVRIHNLPEHVQFKHRRHVVGGVGCEECHGPVETMNRGWLGPDTSYSPSAAFLPAAKLEMGWCMNCHDQKAGPQDCGTCHY